MKYIGATVHYLKNVSGKYELNTKAMSLKVLDSEEEKTAEYVHRLAMDVLFEYDIYVHTDKIVFLSDRGPDIKAALSGYKRNYCLAHMLNNTVAHASEPIIDDMTRKVSKVVKYIKFNGLNSKLSTCLTSYVSTRWNTRYDMFATFLKVHADIICLIKNQKIKDIYNSIDIDELSEVTVYLQTYKELTLEIEGDKEITFVKILPCIETLKAINSFSKDLKIQ